VHDRGLLVGDGRDEVLPRRMDEVDPLTHARILGAFACERLLICA
jgi:hypothetical protein